MHRPLYRTVWIAAAFCTAVLSAQECVNEEYGDCTNTKRNGDCLDPSEFQRLVSSHNRDKSVLSLLRGTIENVITAEDASAIINSLPNFIEASGYEDNTNGKAYAAPRGYAAIGLKELKAFPEAYSKIMDIREKVRSVTEKSLNICPGSLFIDFTTISQKVEGGAHRAHADNCIHYFEDGVAKCDSARVHSYPKRVAASILYLNDQNSGDFEGGQFFYANGTNNGEVEDGGIVSISTGKMVYFTSGVENLHGALPVLRNENKDTEPRRLALALWYVFDKSLMESTEASDVNAPTEIFTLSLPSHVNTEAALQAMGMHLVSRQNKPMIGAWKVSKYGDSALHVLFKDHSAMFSITYSRESPTMVVERHTDTNKKASLQYMLQESVMLHSVLDEAVRLVSEHELNDTEIELFDRGLSDARSKLPARQA
jgi:hypothetical protein